MAKCRWSDEQLGFKDVSTFMGDEEFSMYSAREFEKQNPDATTAQCLAAGRAALKAARAAMTPEEAAKDKEMQAERDRKQIEKIAAEEAKKPETVAERKERTTEETAPSEMDDTQFMKLQMEELHKRFPEWSMTHLIREARAAVHKTAEERARNRHDVPIAIREKEARRRAAVQSAVQKMNGGTLSKEEVACLGVALNELRIAHPGLSNAELLSDLRAGKAQEQPAGKAPVFDDSAGMDVAEFLGAALKQLQHEHGDWTAEKILREARKAVLARIARVAKS